MALDERLHDHVDHVEQSLDIINECYVRISHAASHPVLSNEPTIQQVVFDIRRTRQALLEIANKLVIVFSDEEEET